MKTFFLLLTLIISSAFAQEVKVELNPQNPVMGESFNLVFRVETNSSDEPYISFTPGSLEVLGKSNEGVSIRTVIINGKITTNREILYTYEMRAERSGFFRIKDIKVETGGKTLRVADVTVNVLKEKEKPKDVFMLAIPSKTKVFVGEGIDVSYYLYYRVRIANLDVKDFPKLNNFIKRFHDPKSNEETVNYNGEVFRRSLRYQARVYPIKAGKLFIDSMKCSGQIAVTTVGGGWGFGMQQLREKTFYSLPVEIEVMPLPTANVPKDFTGLVGDHDFKFSLNKEKFLMNEVVEGKLTVQGPGGLENYDGPKIYQDPALEDFEVKSELQETSQSHARKVFDYTYLARSGGQIAGKKISFSIFDPVSGTFKTKAIDIPAISISGVAAPQNTNQIQQDKNVEEKKAEPLTEVKKKMGILAPVFKTSAQGQSFLGRESWIWVINFICVVLISFLLISVYLKKEKSITESHVAIKAIDEIKTKGINYSRLHQLIHLLRKESDEDDNAALSYLIEDSELSLESKNYFKNLILLCEKMGYNSDERNTDFVFEKRYFKEIAGLISKRKNA